MYFGTGGAPKQRAEGGDKLKVSVPACFLWILARKKKKRKVGGISEKTRHSGRWGDGEGGG